ncbi:MAG: DUF3604 domain-containing protein [Chlamydiia bacterium]|nr:DUF3604 domain-containing protein [Chlamydiia bacterium]
MRRSICFVEPPYALAGQINTWRFVYCPSAKVPKGAVLKFDMLSNGREIDWQVPETDVDLKENVIYALMPDGEVVEATAIESQDSYVPQYEFVLPEELSAGDEFSIYLGAFPDDEGELDPELGNACQTTVQRRRPFHLYVDPKGEGYYEDAEVFSLDIRGNVLHTIKVLTPSFVAKNKRFDVIVRFEDEFGNLTSNAPEQTLIELSHELLRENLNWKLFVPETGFITLPNLYFNEAGVYTITLNDLHSGQQFKSAPIRCFNESSDQLFWGVLHGESDRVDSTESIEACLRHFRDDTAMNFFATSAFDDAAETPSEIWRLISNNVAEFNEDDRFSTLLGFQWASDKQGEGVRQFIYAKDGKSIMRRKDAKSSSLKKIYKLLAPKEAVAIPSFSMGSSNACDFSQFTPEFERVVEIYNAWGSSECTEKEGNPFPIKTTGKKGIKEDSSGSVRAALASGLRFGFVAGGLDDRGIYSDLYDSEQVQYFPGVTAVIAPNHSRSALFEGVYNRACYASTGKRIILGISIAGAQMGEELTSADKPGLMVNRHLACYAAGTTDIDKVEIIRNGEVIHTEKASGYSIDFAYDDMQPLESVCITGEHNPHPFVYYYIRVWQADGHMAWSSPIWIDITDEASKKPGRRGRAPKA